MALTVKKVQRAVAAHTFTYAGESVTVEYYPARVLTLTPAAITSWQAELVAAAESGDEALMRSLVAGFFTDLLHGWDVEVDEGGPVVAIDDVDALMELGPHFLGAALLEVVRAANNAKPDGTATSSGFAGGSAPRAASTSSRTAPSQKSTRRRSSRSKSASRPGN